jgi:hypothetical protein
VWRPEALPINAPWFSDGPLLPIEFARHSSDDRIMLVLVPPAQKYAVVRTLWALMSLSDLETAKAALANREGIKKARIKEHIGYWSNETKGGDYADEIGKWATSLRLDGVVWTALPPKAPKKKNGDFPTVEQVVIFLRDLPSYKRQSAGEYIRKAPVQIDTEYRRQIEREFRWTMQERERD